MNLPKLWKRFSFRWTNSFATSRSRNFIFSCLVGMQWSYIIKTLLFHISTRPRFHSYVHGKRLQITITSVIICLSWSERLLTAFRTSAKQFICPCLINTFKISSWEKRYLVLTTVSIIFFHVVHLWGYVLRAQNAYQKRLHIGICFETRLIKTFFNGWNVHY